MPRAPAAPTASAGYSGKAVWQKLGIAPAMRVLVRNAPAEYADLVGLGEGDIAFATPRGGFDLAHVFATSAKALAKEITGLEKRLPAQGVLWISWPKKSAKVATDITEDTVRKIALPLGLVDVKVCAIDAVWSGLKLVWRRDRRSGKA
jgi:ethanolamine utilization microcompartment shell protein EutS